MRPTMRGITGRLLLRLALVAASLAWAAFVFTNTIGDPGRGERVARAVLDDPDARAEITAPIADAVLATTGLQPDQLPGGPATVEAVVDQLLRDPAGARAFIDPFAGSWARLLGEDDPRPAEFDLVAILDDLDALLAPLGAPTIAGADTGREIVVPSVPLPRAQLDWMRGVRSTVSTSIVPLALVAVALAGGALAIGDRRRVTRRIGIWAITAGALWAVLPPLVVWAARSWAPGADAVVAVAIDEATSGLRAVALALVVAGGGAVVASLLVPSSSEATSRRSTRRAHDVMVDATPPASHLASHPAAHPAPDSAWHQEARPEAARPEAARPQTARPQAADPGARTTVLPSQHPGASPAAPHQAAPPPATSEPPADPDSEALWDYYS